MTHDEGWWKVKFDLSLSNPQCLSAFRAYRWRVKDILCILLFINADAIFLTTYTVFLTTDAIKLPACSTIVPCNEHNCAFQRAILHKAICLVGRFLQELRSAEVARAYLIIYILLLLWLQYKRKLKYTVFASMLHASVTIGSGRAASMSFWPLARS